MVCQGFKVHCLYEFRFSHINVTKRVPVREVHGVEKLIVAHLMKK